LNPLVLLAPSAATTPPGTSPSLADVGRGLGKSLLTSGLAYGALTLVSTYGAAAVPFLPPPWRALGTVAVFAAHQAATWAKQYATGPGAATPPAP
jgi:hypothetical protein